MPPAAPVGSPGSHVGMFQTRAKSMRGCRGCSRTSFHLTSTPNISTCCFSPWHNAGGLGVSKGKMLNEKQCSVECWASSPYNGHFKRHYESTPCPLGPCNTPPPFWLTLYRSGHFYSFHALGLWLESDHIIDTASCPRNGSSSECQVPQSLPPWQISASAVGEHDPTLSSCGHPGDPLQIMVNSLGGDSGSQRNGVVHFEQYS